MLTIRVKGNGELTIGVNGNRELAIGANSNKELVIRANGIKGLTIGVIGTKGLTMGVRGNTGSTIGVDRFIRGIELLLCICTIVMVYPISNVCLRAHSVSTVHVPLRSLRHFSTIGVLLVSCHDRLQVNIRSQAYFDGPGCQIMPATDLGQYLFNFAAPWMQSAERR